MTKVVFILLAALSVFSACQPNRQAAKENLRSEIQALESQLLQNPDASKNKELAMQLVEKYALFAKEYPQDSLAPIVLFKAADVARGAGNYGKAIQLWGEIWRKYENHPKAPMSLFLQGFIFDSQLRDAGTAKKYYRQFLEKYPNDPLAEQVKQLLAVVDVKPEELVKKFEQPEE